MYYIGYDIGSSSIKAALVNSETGEALCLVKQPNDELTIQSPEEDWAEQEPETWWQHVCSATHQLLEQNNINPEHILGIGIAYQMHGLVLLDKLGSPLRPAIIWCDSRAVDIGNQAYEKLGTDFCARELLNAPGNFTASKLKWVKEFEPHVYEKTHKFMLPGDYIAFRFSGKAQTTAAGLSEGILWNFKSGQPAQKLLKHYGIDTQLLPEIVPTFGLQARVNAKGAAASGLAEGTPISYRAGDQPNNALSLNVFNPGEVAATGGTSGVFYAISDSLVATEISRVNNFMHVNHNSDQPRIGKLLCINGAGILYRWLRENLQVASYEEMNQLAQEIAIGSEGLRFFPFGNGAERVLDNHQLGAQLSGLNFNLHTRAHVCRAALEGIAFSFMYGMKILTSDGISPSVIRAGNDNLFRSEVFSETVATLIGQDIEIYNTTGAVGAARACRLHSGDFEGFSKQLLNNDFLHRVTPAENPLPYKKAYKHWENKLKTQLSNS